ncbi:MAG TPA: L,D-transpeptidase family protein [Brevundimonas sp.]|jgi:hypothetical protein
MRFLILFGLATATLATAGVVVRENGVAQGSEVVTLPAGPEARIRYPAGALPVLTTADGKRRPVRSVLNVGRQMNYGDYVWDDANIPEGPAWVRIDLTTQTLSLFRAGHEIGTAVILYGTDNKPTPTGVFPILQRAEKHRSSLYDAEMPYMLRLTHDGVAIHASSVRRGSATHGCIGVPREFARRMFAQVRRGSIVSIERSGTSTSGRAGETTA